jgi:hypothetical protein
VEYRYTGGDCERRGEVSKWMDVPIHRWSDNFPEVDSLIVVDFLCPHPLVPQQHWTDSEHIGTGPCDAMEPSAITWTTIYRRLGTGRLGTLFLCISL